MNRLFDYLEPPEDDLVDRVLLNVNRALDRQFGKKTQSEGRKGEFDYDPANDDTKVEFAPEQPSFSTDPTASRADSAKGVVPPPPQKAAKIQDGIIPPPVPSKRQEAQLEIPTMSAKTAISNKQKTQAAQSKTMQRSLDNWQNETKSFSVKIFIWLLLITVGSAAAFYWWVFLR